VKQGLKKLLKKPSEKLQRARRLRKTSAEPKGGPRPFAPDRNEETIPGDRGACEQESTVQGSE
jgi:hypothetical protein